MGSEFTFYDYVDEDGVNVISAWLTGQGPRARAKFNQVIFHLEATPKGQWRRPIVDTLGGDCSGLFEIRSFVNGKQLRLLGFHQPGHRKEVTLVFGTEEKGGEFNPASTCQQAQWRRQKAIFSPRARRRVHVG